MDALRAGAPATNRLKESIITNTFSDPIVKDTLLRVKRRKITQGALQMHSNSCLQTPIECFTLKT